MGILRSATVAVTASGSNGSATGNANSATFQGEILGIAVNHDANAPSTTDIVITDRRTGIVLWALNNSNADVYVAPGVKVVDSINADIPEGDSNGLWQRPYCVDQGVNVAIAGGNNIANHTIVTVHYRR